MACADPETRRQRDRARIARRTAARIEAGLCTRCGRTGPEPERRLCAPCNEKRNRASRARDARLRAGRKPRRDPERARRHGRERDRKLYAERAAAGICTRCGRAPARPERTTCGPCAEKHRARDRKRDARARAQGMPYGGRDPEARRKAARERSRRRSEARQAAGLCVRCAAPAPDGRAYCPPCAGTRSRRRDRKAKREADRRRYAERRTRGDCTSCGRPANGAAECQDCRDAARDRYDARRTAGVCVKCQAPTFDGAAYCAPCAVVRAERRDREAEHAARRDRYAGRRARGRCVACNAPSPGVARCEPCSRRHRESSGAFRGIPVWDPQYTVIEIATGREHGPFDSEADVALCLVFEKLSRDEVEVLCDASPMALLTAPPW